MHRLPPFILLLQLCHVYTSLLHVHVLFTYHWYTCMSCLHITVTHACHVSISLLHMQSMFHITVFMLYDCFLLLIWIFLLLDRIAVDMRYVEFHIYCSRYNVPVILFQWYCSRFPLYCSRYIVLCYQQSSGPVIMLPVSCTVVLVTLYTWLIRS